MSDVTERARQALDGIETPTPWVAKWGGVYGTSGPKNTYRGTDGSPSVATAEGGFVEGEFLEGDADFIAAAPVLVADLVAEVEKLRGEVRALESQEMGAAECCYAHERAIERVLKLAAEADAQEAKDMGREWQGEPGWIYTPDIHRALDGQETQ